MHPSDTVAIDTFGPLPTSKSGNKYIVVMQCLFLRYLVLCAVPENNDKYVVRYLMKLMSEHGVMRAILSDNGSLYAGLLLKKPCVSISASTNGLLRRIILPPKVWSNGSWQPLGILSCPL